MRAANNNGRVLLSGSFSVHTSGSHLPSAEAKPATVLAPAPPPSLQPGTLRVLALRAVVNRPLEELRRASLDLLDAWDLADRQSMVVANDRIQGWIKQQPWWKPAPGVTTANQFYVRSYADEAGAEDTLDAFYLELLVLAGHALDAGNNFAG